VPYYVTDEELTDIWECSNNIWDAPFSSCDVPQELSNDEIDQILALQVRHAGVTSCAAMQCNMPAPCVEHGCTGSGLQ
jgi:hypothetical protein